MFNVTIKKCKEKDCNKFPTFNNPTESTPIYCAKHSKDGMIDVSNPKCLEEGCNISPHYNFADKKKGLYCFKRCK